MILMYLEKVISKKKIGTKYLLLLSLTKRAGSGSVSQRYGSADPDTVVVVVPNVPYVPRCHGSGALLNRYFLEQPVLQIRSGFASF